MHLNKTIILTFIDQDVSYTAKKLILQGHINCRLYTRYSAITKESLITLKIQGEIINQLPKN